MRKTLKMDELKNVVFLIICCLILTKGVQPALSFWLGSAPCSSSSFTASTSPCRRRTKHRERIVTHWTQAIKQKDWSQSRDAPVFINHRQQKQPLIPLSGMQREIKGMFTRIYCETDYSQKTGAPQCDRLIILMLDWVGKTQEVYVTIVFGLF